MSNLQHIAVEMDKLPSNKTPANNQGNHNEALGEIDGRKLRTPRAVPEIDDDDNDERPYAKGSNAGVDDGLLGNGGGNVGMDVPRPNGGRRPSYAFPGYNGPEFVNINGVETPIPDVNAYQHKKTLAQGMMDLALLSANANQLRYVLETGSGHPYYYPSLIFISLSILFQIAVGIGLIWNGRFNIKNEQEICRANKINNYTVIGIFIVTVVNVLISAFGVADRSSVTTT
ncbi:ninjurin-A isoform X1 [Drosophila grimshawi]|uniref:GH15570 n=1 Tax=Drosophila grimshawi TaxID=7222 RepID=B4J0Y5_DROGR|nr:ninjurin-A isoform X1 [Drosophila grimshawi]EDV95806.1 GH15570 [Drosophila grimshawi]